MYTSFLMQSIKKQFIAQVGYLDKYIWGFKKYGYTFYWQGKRTGKAGSQKVNTPPAFGFSLTVL